MMMQKILFALCALVLLTACNKDGEITQEQPSGPSKWIARVLEYVPAPGQFINDPSFGTPENAQKLIGSAKYTASLGGFGGYIVFAFDHRVANREGYDFVIHGNAFDTSSEPGIVYVSVDENGNGIADDTWYELRGEEHDASVADYTITYTRPAQITSAAPVGWADGTETGSLPAVRAHSQSYWPWYAADQQTLTFTGRRIAGNAVKNGNIWELEKCGRGYVDNFSDDYDTIVNNDPDTRYSNKFDISDAIGPATPLTHIDFIKVVSAMNQQPDNLIGETSTEVCGAISLTQ